MVRNFSRRLVNLWHHRLHWTCYMKSWRSICVALLLWSLLSAGGVSGLSGLASAAGLQRSSCCLCTAIASLTLWFSYSFGFQSEICPSRRVWVSLWHQILHHLSVCQLSLVLCVKYDTCYSLLSWLCVEQMHSLSICNVCHPTVYW